MTVLLAILGTALLFVLLALLNHRGCSGGSCGADEACHSCGTRWWKEKDHVA
jgi:hypothetical protein